ncbi:hypothetical protein CVT26_012879 [Gymnopilus dilepis]|uniref:Uncharacterized protein n=1 Tax=Gymnopilus dilepis TaxID=231916 RepID=A0A409YP49_9AGAR|nr:hypothetical protein CVT26_012879 [Gymnopilus dilepis]
MKICTSPEHNSAKTGTCRNVLATQGSRTSKASSSPKYSTGVWTRKPSIGGHEHIRGCGLSEEYSGFFGVQPSETIGQGNFPVSFRIGQSETARTVCGGMPNNSLCVAAFRIENDQIRLVDKNGHFGLLRGWTVHPGILGLVTSLSDVNTPERWIKAGRMNELKSNHTWCQGAVPRFSRGVVKSIRAIDKGRPRGMSPLDHLSSSPSAYKRQLRRRRHIGTLELGEYHVNYHNLSDLET